MKDKDRLTHLLQLHEVNGQEFREKVCVLVTALQKVISREIIEDINDPLSVLRKDSDVPINIQDVSK